jgi:hypothetical protein
MSGADLQASVGDEVDIVLCAQAIYDHLHDYSAYRTVTRSWSHILITEAGSGTGAEVPPDADTADDLLPLVNDYGAIAAAAALAYSQRKDLISTVLAAGLAWLIAPMIATLIDDTVGKSLDVGEEWEQWRYPMIKVATGAVIGVIVAAIGGQKIVDASVSAAKGAASTAVKLIPLAL